MGRTGKRLAFCAVASLALLARGTAETAGLELREWSKERGIATSSRLLPEDAATTFLYEGTPLALRVSEKHLAIDYGRSGVLFDRVSGKPLRRWTILEGWPAQRPEEFPPRAASVHVQRRLVGPGVLNPFLHPYDGAPGADAAQPATVCSAEFAGKTWRAVQPRRFLNQVDRPEMPSRRVAWSDILRGLGEVSYVEASDGSGPSRRYTTADALASNIVTHLAPHGGLLWAACVDVYDTEKKAWGQGGLCSYDPKTDRWRRVAKIDGRDVRWVTLLEVHGDDLWVGFREGDGVEGDQVGFGMGLYPGFYRPKATAIVLARLADGKWTTWARPPRPEVSEPAPTEFPSTLARFGDRVMLFTLADAHQLSGNWEIHLSGFVSVLDLAMGRWRNFDTPGDVGADELFEMVAQRGEILVTSNRGAHRYQAVAGTWQFLDPDSTLKNPEFHAGAAVGDELWLGYARERFGVLGQQGISRYSERTGQWTYMSPETLGTASPVRRIVALPGGDVWVLFCREPYLGAAMMPDSYYPSERRPRPTGLGRWAKGKWEFPAVVLRNTPGPLQAFVADDMAAIGDRLVYGTRGALFVGPEPWTSLTEGNLVGMLPTADGKAVEILRSGPRTRAEDSERYELAVYDGKFDNVEFRPVKISTMESSGGLGVWNYIQGDSLVDYRRSVGGDWVRLPASGATTWAVGPLSPNLPIAGDHHTLLATDRAYWILSRGEVIRLDRAAVDATMK